MIKGVKQYIHMRPVYFWIIVFPALAFKRSQSNHKIFKIPYDPSLPDMILNWNIPSK